MYPRQLNVSFADRGTLLCVFAAEYELRHAITGDLMLEKHSRALSNN
jgi:hypothetical protein